MFIRFSLVELCCCHFAYKIVIKKKKPSNIAYRISSFKVFTVLKFALNYYTLNSSLLKHAQNIIFIYTLHLGLMIQLCLPKNLVINKVLYCMRVRAHTHTIDPEILVFL